MKKYKPWWDVKAVLSFWALLRMPRLESWWIHSSEIWGTSFFSYCIQLPKIYAISEILFFLGHEYKWRCPLGLCWSNDAFHQWFIDPGFCELLRRCVCLVWWWVCWCCDWLKQLDAVLYNDDAAKVASPYGLKLRQNVNDWFSVSRILRSYCNFFASILLKLNDGFLILTYMFANLWFPIYARFIVYRSS